MHHQVVFLIIVKKNTTCHFKIANWVVFFLRWNSYLTLNDTVNHRIFRSRKLIANNGNTTVFYRENVRNKKNVVMYVYLSYIAIMSVVNENFCGYFCFESDSHAQTCMTRWCMCNIRHANEVKKIMFSDRHTLMIKKNTTKFVATFIHIFFFHDSRARQ